MSDDISKYSAREFPRGTTFHHRDDLDFVQCNLREYSGTSVLIYDQTCAAEKRRRRKRGTLVDPKIRPFINTLVCEGCGDCGIASNCLSVVPEETEYGRKRKIEQSSCNKDMSCVKGFCPSFVTVTGGNLRRPQKSIGEYDFSDLIEPKLPEVTSAYGIVIAGIGGTGVTTLGAILGMAAHLEDRGASILDMTGLAQKFGAVITHLQISQRPEDIYATRIAAGGAKLVLGCDLVVAAANDSMVKVNRGNAFAVINEHEAMTAEFTRNPDSIFPGQSMRAIIEECVGDNRTFFIDSTGAAEQLLGSTTAANLFLTGFAYQKGLIPISSAAIFEAITLNGTAIEENICAFNLGRRQCQAPKKIHLTDKRLPALTRLDDVIADRQQYLTEYQNVRYAEKYRSRVEQFASVATEELTLQLAKNYFKLLAYKDEYEVARLYAHEQFRTALEQQFEGDYKLKFHLAPPLIAPVDRHTGLPKKITFGAWMLPVFRLLAKFKFLRSTPLDPFGYTHDRKLEQALIVWYENLIDRCEQALQADNHEIMSQLIRLPEMIRGYGYVKRRNAESAKVEAERLFIQLETKPQTVNVFDPRAA